jgi:hypothetical protein
MNRRLLANLLLASATASLEARLAWHAPTAQAATLASLPPTRSTKVILALAERLETNTKLDYSSNTAED